MFEVNLTTPLLKCYDHFAELSSPITEMVDTHHVISELLQNALTMTVAVERKQERVSIQVELVNDRTGHHVPTDSPLRHLILTVEVTDEQGQYLAHLEGPVLPEWTGSYRDLPGKVYAKVLEELWTGLSPSMAYWNPTRVLSDNRIAAFETDTSTYVFAAPGEGEVTVKVTLIFRRAFIQVMDWKAWEAPDIVMEQMVVKVEN